MFLSLETFTEITGAPALDCMVNAEAEVLDIYNTGSTEDMQAAAQKYSRKNADEKQPIEARMYYQSLYMSLLTRLEFHSDQYINQLVEEHGFNLEDNLTLQTLGFLGQIGDNYASSRVLFKVEGAFNGADKDARTEHMDKINKNLAKEVIQDLNRMLPESGKLLKLFACEAALFRKEHEEKMAELKRDLITTSSAVN